MVGISAELETETTRLQETRGWGDRWNWARHQKKKKKSLSQRLTEKWFKMQQHKDARIRVVGRLRWNHIHSIASRWAAGRLKWKGRLKRQMWGLQPYMNLSILQQMENPVSECVQKLFSFESTKQIVTYFRHMYSRVCAIVAFNSI